jgi:hypothetical protein
VHSLQEMNVSHRGERRETVDRDVFENKVRRKMFGPRM